MEVFFLSAGDVRLTKVFNKDHTVEPYPLVRDFSSTMEPVASINGFFEAMKKHASLGNCLIKGKLNRELKFESRAGSTSPTDLTEWVCFDIDGMQVSSVEGFIHKCLPDECADVSYIVQYSASHVALGPRDGRISAHLFMLLDKPISASTLKEWLRSINLKNEVLKKQLALNAAGTTLKWRLDPSVAQNDKIIYIAPPVCRGFDAVEPQSIQLVLRAKQKLIINQREIHPAKNDQEAQAVINELRKDMGLKPRKHTYRAGTDVVTNADRVVEWDAKVARGYVYFNLNGGDSWGYYHPEEDPSVIYNFKDEPPYETKALLPDYWEEVTRNQKPREEGTEYFVFRDIRNASYWNGWYDKGGDKLELYPAKTKDQLGDFMIQHGYAKPDFIPDFKVAFDVNSDVVYDKENRIVNLYQPSDFMRRARHVENAKVPKTIKKLLEHVTGGDKKVYDHFLNWIACVVRYRKITQTAWVLSGITGTGKGTLIHHVLTPLIGKKYVQVLKLSDIEENFNPWLEKCILLVLDEASMDDVQHIEKIMSKVRTWVTDPTVSIRPMHASSYQAENHVNILVASNKYNAIQIADNDRRFNVAPRVEDRVNFTPMEFNAIQDELQDFADFLLQHPADEDMARRIIETAAREEMKKLTQTSAVITAKAISTGDALFLLQNAPGKGASNLKSFNSALVNVPEIYLDVCRRIAEDARQVKLTRQDLYAIFEHTVGNIPATSNKFTAFLRHQHISLRPIRLADDTREMGTTVNFRVDQEYLDWVKKLPPKVQSPAQLKVVAKK